MQNNGIQPLKWPALIFVLLNAFFLLGEDWLRSAGFDVVVLIIANAMFLLLAIIAFRITRKSLDSKNPNHFMRALYGSFILKFFVTAIVAFIYIVVITKKNVNKPALYASLGLYVLYSILEVRALLGLLKKPKNEQA